MKRIIWNKCIRRILVLVITVCMLPIMPPEAVKASADYSISLNGAVLTSGVYTYPEAQVSGDAIRTIIITFSNNVSNGDQIILPVLPSGFTVSSGSNDYAKRINLAEGISADAVQSFLRETGFTTVSTTQTLQVIVTSDIITGDTYYNADTQHYYQYITNPAITWTDAYQSAKGMTYMGRTGYLATVTSLAEDTYINSLSGGRTGWLGGTILKNTGSTESGLYYTEIKTNEVVAGGWYWACGPEIGTTFYSTNSLYPDASASNAATKDLDPANNTYYNWARGTASYEPNNRTDSVGSDQSDYETCLTTLQIANNYGKQGTSFTWNDKRYDGYYQKSAYSTDDWGAKGYFVEYGNQTTGDSTTASAGYASASGKIYETSPINLTDITWTSALTYTCDIDLPSSSKMLTISVDHGYFTVPDLGTSTLNYLGGTSGTNYIGSYNVATHFSSAVFSYDSVASAESLLDDIIYTTDGMKQQTIKASSSAVAPLSGDLYYEGHFYRYVSGSINWANAVISARGTVDPYFGGRGYLATAVNQPENSILLKLVDNGLGGTDHWHDAWMGGLWQRNKGSIAAPSIDKGTDGYEIDYQDICDANTAGTLSNMLIDYSKTYGVPADSEYIFRKTDSVKYYWVDGPEAGEELTNNTASFAPWHVTGSSQDEPNMGDFIYIGWEGAYWDDLSAFDNDAVAAYQAKEGYIVEFSGFIGGSTAGVVKTDTKTVYSATVKVYTDTTLSAAPGDVSFRQGGNTINTAQSSSTGVYQANLANGVYDIFINGEDTGNDISISGADAAVDINYYTVHYSVTGVAAATSGSSISATAGGTAITEGTAVLAGKSVILSVTGAGNGSGLYSYRWSGDGTNGETTSSITLNSLSSTVNTSCTIKAVISGTVSVTGAAVYGGTLTSDLSGVLPAEAVSYGAITYQWLYSTTEHGAYHAITGATISTFPINDTLYTQKYIKLCVSGIEAEGYSGSIDSDEISIAQYTPPSQTPTGTEPPVITKTPKDFPSQVKEITEKMSETGKDAPEENVTKALETYEQMPDIEKKKISDETMKQLGMAIASLPNVTIVVDNKTEESDANVTDQTGLSLIVTSEDLKSGDDIVVTLKVEKQNSITQVTKELEAKAKEIGVTIGGYLDVTLYKQVGSSKPEMIASTMQPIKITIAVPSDIRGYGRYLIYREHQGVITELKDLDANENTVTFETDRFSTYTIAYSDAPAPAYSMDGRTITLNGGSVNLSEYLSDLTGNAEVSYHSCSHTIVRISDKGVISGLRKGNSIVSVIVKQNGVYSIFSTKIIVKKQTKVETMNTFVYQGIKYQITGKNICEVGDNRNYTLGTVVIPDYVADSKNKKYKVIGVSACAFMTDTKIKSLTLGKYIAYVEDTSFAGCNQLGIIKVAAGNRYYKTAAVYTGMLLSKDGTRLVTYAGARNIVKIPDTVKQIGAYAFAISKVTQLVIPTGVDRIDPCAFAHCTHLKRVTFQGEIVEMSLNCIFDCVPASCIINVQAKLIDAYQSAFETAVTRGHGQFQCKIEAIDAKAGK